MVFPYAKKKKFLNYKIPMTPGERRKHGYCLKLNPPVQRRILYRSSQMYPLKLFALTS
jgi:hypothetical protein